MYTCKPILSSFGYIRENEENSVEGKTFCNRGKKSSDNFRTTFYYKMHRNSQIS